MKHRKSKFRRTVLLFGSLVVVMAATIFCLPQVLAKQQAMSTAAAKVTTVRIVKTYQDFQNASHPDATTSIVKLLDISANTEILGFYAVKNKEWSPHTPTEFLRVIPEDSFGVDICSPDNIPNIDGNPGLDMSLPIGESQQFNNYFCSKNYSLNLVFRNMSTSFFDDFTQGELEFFISYITH